MTQHEKMFRLLAVFSFCLVFVACNLPNNAVGTPDPSIQQTSVAQTVEVLRTQLVSGNTPEAPQAATNTPEQIQPTATFTSTVSIPTATFTPTITAGPTNTTAPTYKAGNVIDKTVIDNTEFKPNEGFTKTWTVTNLGTATWTTNFKVVFVNGDAMGGPASQVLGRTVAPGESVDITVVLKAPATTGTYQGNWMLQTESGASFGIGTNADGPFWVKIKVVQNFAVTKAEVTITPANYTGVCPATMAITASITSTSAGSVTYYYKTPFGNSTTYTLVFDVAGTKTSTAYSVVVPSTMAFSASVYIDNPNHQEFATVTVPVNCIP